MSEVYDMSGGYGPMPHATIEFPEIKVHKGHPFVSEPSHQKLMDYLNPRLAQAKRIRDSHLPRFVQIDKDVSGWMKLPEEDRIRRGKQAATGIPQAVLMNLPLMFVHLDDMVTYLTQTFSPGKAMFYHTGKPDETDAANQMVLLMNNHAIYGGWYRNLLRGCWSILKYNLGGFFSSWEEDYGPKVERQPDGSVSASESKVWAGNKIFDLDMYNTFLDPGVHPTMVHKDGEYGARAFMRSHYWLAQRVARGLYANCKDMLDNDQGYASCKYYKHPPVEAQFSEDESTQSNWISRLADNSEMGNQGFELVEVFIRLNPTDFNLLPPDQRKDRNRYEIWRITILNGERVIEVKAMPNVHNHLPFYLGLLNDDGMGRNQKSVGELLQPMQNFASHTMNIHVQATRKKLFGLTAYDPSVIDLSQIPRGEVVGHIPAKVEGSGKNLSDAIFEFKSEVDTERTMSDLAGTMDLINQFFPTQALPSQIAGIDRAVTNQVAAVQNGVNRRQQKGAMLLDSSCLRPLRFGLYYNILQFQEDAVEISDFRGRTITVDLSQLKETDLPFIIGMGLKAIDRQMVADRLQQLIFALIQNPNSANRVDILAMIDYWSDMLDIDVDMKQFEIQQPAAVPGVPGAESAPAGETGIQPMTDPQAVTQPIF